MKVPPEALACTNLATQLHACLDRDLRRRKSSLCGAPYCNLCGSRRRTLLQGLRCRPSVDGHCLRTKTHHAPLTRTPRPGSGSSLPGDRAYVSARCAAAAATTAGKRPKKRCRAHGARQGQRPVRRSIPQLQRGGHFFLVANDVAMVRRLCNVLRGLKDRNVPCAAGPALGATGRAQQ